VEMSCQQKIEATSKKAGQCFPRTAGKVRGFIAWRQIERMMRYHDSLDAIGKPAELFFNPEHLPVIDTAALDDESPGRVDAGNCDFIIEVEGLEVIGNVLLIGLEAASKPRIKVVQRNVMVSRHNYLRCWECPQECTSSFEFTWPGTLRQVARNGDYVWLDFMNRMNQPFHDRLISSAEVDVGEMD
jgi:hypothetical protein